MDALAEQEDDDAAAQAPVATVPSPKPAPIPEEQPLLNPPPSAARQRSDLYAKKMSELLLKGWKMLGQNCPETGDVPLMQFGRQVRRPRRWTADLRRVPEGSLRSLQ